MNTIPCKRPKVTVDPRPDDRNTTFDVTCHVPGCRFTYPADKQFCALSADANDQARMHRQAHRAAVPATRIEKDPLYDVYCDACGGHRRSFDTRREAQVWLDEHLATEHRVVAC